jgi:NitT/TauT family transport system substrate-binding protein
MVKTMRWMATHSAAEIADKMPKEYMVGNRDLYVQGLAAGKSQFTVDGRMPANGPETVLKVMSSFSKNVMGKQIDLSKTYSVEFVDAANKGLK